MLLRLTYLFLAMAFAIPSFAQPAKNDTTVSNQQYNFSLFVPTGWDVKMNKNPKSNVPLLVMAPIGQESVDIYKSDVADNYRENVSVEVIRLSDEDSLSVFFNTTYNTFHGLYEGFLETDRGGDKNMKWFTFSFVGNSELAMKAYVACYTFNNTGYKVIAISESRRYDQYYEDFKMMLVSLKPAVK